MALRIEDYALIGDTQTAALVGDNGSIDWLCLPRFDSDSCFAALLGDEENGRWILTPLEPVTRVRRRYRPGTLVLETELSTASGTVRLVDCMPPRAGDADLVRIVEGVEGRVDMTMELVVRFGHGRILPWVRQVHGLLVAVAGPDAVYLQTPVPTEPAGMTTVARFSVTSGERIPFRLCWYPSHLPPPPPLEPLAEVRHTEEWWREWSSHSTYRGPWAEPVERSLLTLKALTYGPTGGIVAAPTTSLPEHLGGPRNWDYRYCWLRDASFTLAALLGAGYVAEAVSFRDWLLRAVAGDPDQMQVMYGVCGERRLPEYELDWLAGYAGSQPVRIGNAASGQFQLDVYGEVIDAAAWATVAGVADDPEMPAAPLVAAMVDHVERVWREPDEGIWEIRGPRQHFTHSKVLAWVALDRAARLSAAAGGDPSRWRRIAEEIHRDVCENAWDAEAGTFVQHYGTRQVDAALLQLPLVGFLPPTDPRMIGTVNAVEQRLARDGLVARYDTTLTDDGLTGGEGAFLICSFWLVEALAMLGRRNDAIARFEQLLGLRNDVGLLAEQYDPVGGRQLGNFPQAFSHIGLINSATLLAGTPRLADRLGSD
jgi:GH15 family glucan-1,4-alpha-glucosidase